MYTTREKYYSLHSSQDVEGRYTKEVFRTGSKAIADLWKKQNNWNSVVEHDELIIFIESQDDFTKADTEKKKKAALSKLTVDERKLLGLE